MLKRNDRWNTRLVALAAGTAALALVGYSITRPAMAGPGKHGGDRGWRSGEMKQHIGMMLDALDATASQRSTIEAEMAALQPVLADMDERRHRLLQAAHEMVQSETIDTARLEQLRLDMVSRIDQQTRELTQRMATIASVLTLEQRAELGEIMKTHHGGQGHTRHGTLRQHFGH